MQGLGHSWTRKCNKVQDSTKNLSLTCEHTTATENFQHTNFYSYHPLGVTKDFIKEEAIRLRGTNSSQLTFEDNMKNFEKRLLNKEYPTSVIEKHLSEVKFSDRKASLKQKNRDASTRILPFVTQYYQPLPNLKTLLMRKWHLIQIQPQLKEIVTEPPLISCRKGKSLKDILVRTKL